jgi:hypothetical protein
MTSRPSTPAPILAVLAASLAATSRRNGRGRWHAVATRDGVRKRARRRAEIGVFTGGSVALFQSAVYRDNRLPRAAIAGAILPWATLFWPFRPEDSSRGGADDKQEQFTQSCGSFMRPSSLVPS